MIAIYSLPGIAAQRIILAAIVRELWPFWQLLRTMSAECMRDGWATLANRGH